MVIQTRLGHQGHIDQRPHGTTTGGAEVDADVNSLRPGAVWLYSYEVSFQRPRGGVWPSKPDLKPARQAEKRLPSALSEPGTTLKHRTLAADVIGEQATCLEML